MPEERIVPTVINGQKRTEGPRFAVNSPLGSEASIKVEARITPTAELLEACKVAHEARAKWAQVTPDKKRDIFYDAAKILEKKVPELKEVIQSEMGMHPAIVELLTADAVSILKELGSLIATHPHGTVPVPGKGRSALVYREPIGAVLGIAPWNAPPPLSIRASACPIAAGCPVVLKTSERCPLSHYLVLSSLLEAGLPDGVLNIVHVDEKDVPEAVATMIAQDEIRKINFTGSTGVGRKLAIEAAKNLKPITLELGGKTAVMVDEDADLDEAAKTLLIGGWANAGQICMSTDRVYVVEKVHDKLLTAIEKVGKELLNGSPVISPLVSKDAEKRVQALAAQAKEGGAKEVVGDGYRGVLANVPKGADITTQEIFGPLLYVEKVSNLEQAVEICNQGEYGLNCAIWTGNIGRGLQLARKVECGGIHINGNSVFDHGTIPHGGVKGSGYGRFGGHWGLDEFSFVKCITIPEI